MAAVIIAVALAVVIRGSAVLARHRLERAADLAALAAAEQIGRAGQPCAAAARIAAANGAVLASCIPRLDPSARSGTVAIIVHRTVNLAVVGAHTLAARSKAGRQHPAIFHTSSSGGSYDVYLRFLRPATGAVRPASATVFASVKAAPQTTNRDHWCSPRIPKHPLQQESDGFTGHTR